MTRFGYIIAILAASVTAPACTESISTPTQPTTTDPGTTESGTNGNTFDHDNSGLSPWDLLQRLEVEGPPSFTSHMHGCVKVKYLTLGNVLTSLGVNTQNTTALSAGDLYGQGKVASPGYNAMGGANYPNRIRENVNITTSGASREFDVFAAAAPEVIAAFTGGTIARCPGAQLFDTSGKCVAAGITCLLGVPATQSHLDYCNLTVSTASTPTLGQSLAVAAILAAAYTCE